VSTASLIHPVITSGARNTRRLEYKFLVPITWLSDFRAFLKPYLMLDKFSAAQSEKQYTVRSVYYDTRGFKCYEEKIEGFMFKKKLRIRGYNTNEPDSIVFLEIKHKEQDFISKNRAPVLWQKIKDVFSDYHNHSILPFEPDTKSEDDARRFLYNYYQKKMMPVVLVAYEREAFYSRFDDTLRITFDKNVRSRLYPSLDSLYNDRGMKFVIPNHFVFEVKFYGGLPQWIHSVIYKFDLYRLAVSKYAMGIDCHNIEKKFTRGIGHTVEFPKMNVMVS
jgi:hypothetical protein